MSLVPVYDTFQAILADDPDRGGSGRLYVDRYAVRVMPCGTAIDTQSVPVEPGDLGYADSNDFKPASAQADAGTEAANQESFHDLFIGVALEAQPGGSQPQTIRVATKGIFRATCPSNTFEVGALIGASENAGGNGLEDQQVEGTATPNLSIALCTKRVAAAATEVEFEIFSTIAHRGVQTIS